MPVTDYLISFLLPINLPAPQNGIDTVMFTGACLTARPRPATFATFNLSPSKVPGTLISLISR